MLKQSIVDRLYESRVPTAINNLLYKWWYCTVTVAWFFTEMRSSNYYTGGILYSVDFWSQVLFKRIQFMTLYIIDKWFSHTASWHDADTKIQDFLFCFNITYIHFALTFWTYLCLWVWESARLDGKAVFIEWCNILFTQFLHKLSTVVI
jgi:hypothetical protein